MGVISARSPLQGRLFDDRADIVLRHIAHKALDGLALAVYGLVQDARGRDLELIAPRGALFSIRMDSDISPRPATLNVGRALQFRHAQGNVLSVSRKEAPRSCREVTNLPSRPAKGESLIEKVISIVGEIFLRTRRLHALGGADGVADGIKSPMPDRR